MNCIQEAGWAGISYQDINLYVAEQLLHDKAAAAEALASKTVRADWHGDMPEADRRNDGREDQYGFILTTGQFSDRARSYVDPVSKKHEIELIAPHGLGLHRTDIGPIYMNADIL
jgi:hypothetical protein